MMAVLACSNDTAEDYLARAQAAAAKADYPAAVIELKNVLRLEPESSQARGLLGEAYLAMGDTASAAKELQRALELGGAAEELKPPLAEALIAQGEYHALLDMRLDGLTVENKSRVLALQAQAALAQDDSWSAQELIEKALQATPDSTEVFLAKAQLQATNGDTAGAMATLDKLLAIDSKNDQAWSLRGDMLVTQQDFKGALAAYSKAVDAQPRNFNALFKRALMHLQLGDYQAAQPDAKALALGTRNSPQANYIQGLLHYQAGRYAAAITSLTAAEPIYEQYPLALFFLAGANLQEGHADLASNQAERFYALVPGSIQGRKLLSVLRLQQGNFAAVLSLLQPVLDNDPDDIDALNLKSNALLRSGQMDQAVLLLERVAKLQPDSPGAQIRLGAGLLMEGRNEDAVQYMETALELDPQFQLADILLVLNYTQKGDTAAAIAAAESYKSRHASEVTPYNLLGKLYMDTGDTAKATAAFNDALALDAADPGANHYLAQMALAADNDVAAARKRYETALAGHPDSAPTLIQLALLDARESNDEAIVAHLEQARSVDPTGLQPRLLLARYYLSKGKPDQVAPLFTDLDAMQQQSPDVLPLLAMAQLAMRDSSAAKYTLEQLLKSTPDSAPIRHAMAMAAAGSGDDERVVEELQRAIALDGNYVLSRIALAKIALTRKDNAEFEKQLGKLIELAPENPEVVLLQAAAAQNKGDKKRAIELAEKAHKLAPSPNTVVSLANYYTMNGNRQGAQQVYNSWLQDNPGDTPVRMAYANSLLETGQEDSAVAQYTQVLEVDPKNVTALNNTAWLLREKSPTTALEHARRAAEVAPDSPEVLDTMAVVEYLNGDYRRAERAIERALANLPDNPSLIYHSAMIAAALDDKDAARATLEELLATGPQFPELAEAVALLKELAD